MVALTVMASTRRSVVLYLDPGPDGRGEEITLFGPDWDELEPAETERRLRAASAGVSRQSPPCLVERS